MRDPFAWSIPLGRIFGITIRIHLLFPIVAVALVLRAATKEGIPPNQWIDASVVMILLFLSVLLHEFGHCFGARMVQGDANEILIWPLGGLARVEVPHTPRANFLMTAAGPAVNLILFLFAGLLLILLEPSIRPPWLQLGYNARDFDQLIHLTAWNGSPEKVHPLSPTALLNHLFFVNWVLFLLNTLILAFPLDGGGMLQAVLWNYVGYRRGTLIAVFVGYVFMVLVILVALVANEVLLLCLGIMIYVACKHQWFVLETGGEDSLFGTYDFSQGYTSLERDQPPAPSPPRQSWWERWRQKRAAKKLQREMERREAEESRMDQLLEKISAQGLTALTDEERRFMKHFSDRYKNRHQ